jgi:hypothetical protein
VLHCALACLILLGAACRTPNGEQHIRNELSFLVPYVDVDQEERAVRGTFAQRRLMMEDTLRGDGYAALAAVSLDHSKSAVRIITRRGVVVGEDADSEDWFAFAQVALLPALPPVAGQPLIGLLKTARGRSDGCVALYRLFEDGRALQVSMRVERFGSRACVIELRAGGEGRFAAHIGWPDLATLGSPWLEVALEFEKPRAGRAEAPSPALRLVEDDWLDRESARMAPAPPVSAPFSARHALGIARAALALAAGRSTDQQLAAYRAALARVPPASPEAEIIGATSAHIERGWSDDTPEAPENHADAASEPETPDPDALVIEPAPP